MWKKTFYKKCIGNHNCIKNYDTRILIICPSIGLNILVCFSILFIFNILVFRLIYFSTLFTLTLFFFSNFLNLTFTLIYCYFSPESRLILLYTYSLLSRFNIIDISNFLSTRINVIFLSSGPHNAKYSFLFNVHYMTFR